MHRKLAERSAHSGVVDQELRILLQAGGQYDNLEAALRLRALSEIAEVLGTDELIGLAGLVVSRTLSRPAMSLMER